MEGAGKTGSATFYDIYRHQGRMEDAGKTGSATFYDIGIKEEGKAQEKLARRHHRRWRLDRQLLIDVNGEQSWQNHQPCSYDLLN